MSSLGTLLASDALDVAALERLYAAYREAPDFAADAIRAMRVLDESDAWRAVWLLHRRARDGGLAAAEVSRVIGCADEVTHWIARLNLCQLLATTGCPPEARAAAFSFLSDCFADRRVVVRAWAVSALARFKNDPAFAEPVAAMLRQAKADRRKSMQARLRHLR